MSSATPTIVARLYDGAQHVRNMPLYLAVDTLITNESNPSSRLEDLDFDVPSEIPRATWKLDGMRGSDFIDPLEYVREFGVSPLARSLMHTAAGQALIVVQWAEYRRIA